MIDPIARRGPDQRGSIALGTTALGAARLRLVGGTNGDQPYRSPGSGSILVQNGEIYNWRELARRFELDARSDTEVLSRLIEREGPDGLSLCRGNFALAFHDPHTRRVLLARDSFGQRPLFWILEKDTLYFASEVKSLLAAGVKVAVDHDALDVYSFLQFFEPARTPFSNIHAVEPGTWLSFDTENLARVSSGRIPWPQVDESLRLDELFSDVARLQGERTTIAAATLSGGLDSTATVGALAGIGKGVDFALVGAFAGADDLDERPWARIAAAANATPLDEVVIDARAFRDAWPLTLDALEMPVAGPGSVPTFILAREAARRGARILYCGSGGDELFGGYERLRILQLLEGGAHEGTARRGYAPLEKSMRAQTDLRDAYFASLDRRGRVPWSLARSTPTIGAMRRRLAPELDHAMTIADGAAAFERRLLLPGLLQVDDRTSAAFGMEGRSLFLDQVLWARLRDQRFETLSTPSEPRRLFRETLGCFIPPKIRVRQDKMGFPLPLRAWLAGPLREFVIDTLGSRKAVDRGLVRRDAIGALLLDDGANGRALFGLVSLELWHQRFVDTPRRDASFVEAKESEISR